MKKRIYYILCLSMLLMGCRDGEVYQSAAQVFVEKSSAIGLYLNGRQEFTYNPELHQTAQRGSSYRIQTDDQSTLIHLLFEPLPTQQNPTTRCTIVVRNLKAIENKAYTFEWVEERDGKMWLWNEEGRMGLVLPILKGL